MKGDVGMSPHEKERCEGLRPSGRRLLLIRVSSQEYNFSCTAQNVLDFIEMINKRKLKNVLENREDMKIGGVDMTFGRRGVQR